MGVLHSPRAGSQPVGTVRGAGRRLPEWKGWQPVTACRAMDDGRQDNGVGRAAPVNGCAAGGDTGAGGGFGMRAWMTTTEVAQALGVSERQAQRLARPHRMGIERAYISGRAKYRQRYDRQAVMELAGARGSNLCASCGGPARATAYTCGSNACASKAWRARAAAYAAARA